jgi:hypothetical protein
MRGSKKSRMRMKVPSTTTPFPHLSPILTAEENIVGYFLDRLCIYIYIYYYLYYYIYIYKIISILDIFHRPACEREEEESWGGVVRDTTVLEGV